MIVDQVRSLCHQMRLFGFHQSAERRAAEASASQLSPLEFLRLLLEDELLARRERTAKALLTVARFRSEAALEDWDQSFDRGLSKAKIRELTQLGFCHSRENLLLLGGTGTGKTHLAVAIGRRCCAENLSTIFLPMNFLFEEAHAQKVAGRYVPHIKKLGKANVIILDDFGLRSYTHEEATILVDLLEERYKKGAVVVTSQVTPGGWIKLFEDPVIGEAIVDRLRFPAQELLLRGGSYREKMQGSRPKAAAAGK